MNVVRNVLRDLFLLVANFGYLFYIRKINEEDRSFIRGLVPTFKEHTIRQPWYKKAAMFIIPRTWPVRRTPTIIEHESVFTNDRYKFVFVNGIMSSEEKMSLYLSAISKVFKTDVTGIYNPSDGIFVDLIETALSRTLDASEKVVTKTEQIVVQFLKDNPDREIILMGHSQGGLIVVEVLKRMIDHYGDVEMFKRLQVYTFGSAADDLDLSSIQNNTPHVEHFINQKDFVARIGTLANQHMISGDVKVADRTGHSFHLHYLPGILSKQYGDTKLIDVYKNGLMSNIPTGYIVEETHDYYS